MDEMQEISFRLNKNVSLVVSLRDDLRPHELPLERVMVYLDGCIKSPIRNLERDFVFTELPKGQYRLCIKSTNYYDESIPIQIDDNLPVVSKIRLKPKITYPFRSKDTLIRAKLFDNNGKSLSGIGIRAVVLEKPIATVGKKTGMGDKSIHMFTNWGSILDGDEVMITSGEMNELYRVDCKEILGNGARMYSTDKSIDIELKTGTKAYYAMNTKTSDQGEIVIYFKDAPDKQFCVEIEDIDASWKHELEVKEFKCLNYGSTVININKS